jgi:hypothetical protein
MRLAAMLAVAALAACGGGNELSGSIEESFSLEFDRVRIRKQDQALLIEYLREVSGGTEKVCQVVVDTDGLSLASDSTIKGGTFLSRVQVNRVASGGTFPPVDEGQIDFDTYEFEDGGEMQGEFDVVFDGGRTLHGGFEGDVKEVELD